MRHLPQVILACLAIGALAGCTGAKTQTNESGDSEVVQAGDLDAFNLKPGNCLVTADLDNENITDVPAVPCADPHDAEVIASLETDEGFYDSDKIAADAELKCQQAMTDYLGVPWGQSSLNPDFLTPSSESWTAGDREITCMAWDSTGANLTESVKGKGADYLMESGETKKNFDDLATGDCMVSENQANSDYYYLTIDCGESHDVEVMGAVDSTVDGMLYDEDAIDADAEEKCLAMFDDYVGAGADPDELDLNYLRPSAWSWGEGDRTILCLAQAPDATLTASVAGAGK